MATFFVTSNGSGSGASWATPASSSIINSAVAGNTYWMAAGAYGPINISGNGTSGSPITVKAATAASGASSGQIVNGTTQQVTITITGGVAIQCGNFTIIDGGLWNASQSGPGLPSVYGIKISLNTINGAQGVVFGGNNSQAINIDVGGPAPNANGYNQTTSTTNAFFAGSSCLVSGCSAHDMDTAIQYVSQSCTIEYSKIYNISSRIQISGNNTDPHPDWYFSNQSSGGSPFTNLVIRYCLVANVVSEGCFMANFGTVEPGGTYTSLTFYGNICFQGNSATNGCNAIEVNTQGGSFGAFFIYNNTFVDWSKNAIVNDGPNTGYISSLSVVKNNLFCNTNTSFDNNGSLQAHITTNNNGYYLASKTDSPADSNPIAISSNPFNQAVSSPWVANSAATPASINVAVPQGYDPSPYVSSFQLTSAASGTATSIAPVTGNFGVTYNFLTDMNGVAGANLGALQGAGGPTAPTVSVSATTNITQTSATLNGSVTATGGSAVTSDGFDYGLTTGYGSSAAATTVQSGAFSANISGLSVATQYFFRSKAVNAIGTGFATGSFTTLSAPVVPTVTAPGATVGSTVATLNGILSSTGGAAITADGFQWGPTTSYGNTVSATAIVQSGAFVSAQITGLTNGTTYHYISTATNSVGQGVSADQSFTPSATVPPTVVQHVSSASNNNVSYAAGTGVAGNPFHINLPNPCGAGNCLILCVSNPTTTITVTDNATSPTNTWSLARTITGGSSMTSVYVALNVKAGTQFITVTLGSAQYACQFCLTEFYNILSASAIDVTGAASTSGTSSISSGAITTTTAGDLIYQYGYNTANKLLTSTNMTGMTPGVGFKFLSADIMLGTFVQYTVQVSAGSITPTMTLSGSTDAFNTVAIALKSGSQGTAPPAGIRIIGVHHVNQYRAHSYIIPSYGNLLYLSTAFGVVNVPIGPVSSVPSNTWVELDQSNPNSQNGPPQCWYAQNAATSPTLSLTTVGATSIGTQVQWVIYDITGAAVSAFDRQFDNGGVGPTETVGNFTLGTITPTTANGLVFGTVATYFGVLTSVNGAGFVDDSIKYGGEIDADLMDNADGYAHYYNPSAATVNFNWTLGGADLGAGGTSTEIGQFVAFKGGGDTTPPTAPSAPTLLVLSSTQIKLTMSTAATDNVDGATALIYHVERRIGAAAFSGVDYATFQGTVAPVIYTDNGCGPSTSYGYRVRASDTSGNLGPYATSAANVNTPAGGGAVPLAFVQVNSTQPASTGTITCPFTGAQTAGNTNAVIIGWDNSTALTITSVSDNINGAYTPAAMAGGTGTGSAISTNGSIKQAIYYRSNIAVAGAGANTVTVVLSGASSFTDLRVLEYSGIASVSPVDVTATTNGASTLSTVSITTTNPHDLIVVGGTTHDIFNVNPGTGFTRRVYTVNDDIADDDIVSAVGTYTDACSQSSSASWVMQAIAFKAIAPSTPTGLIVNNPTSTSLGVNWTESTDSNYTASVLTYSLKRQASGGAFSVINSAIPGTGTGTVNYTDSGLSPNVLYGYQVSANDPGGNSSAYTSAVSLSTSSSSSIGWSEYEIVTAKSTYAATYTLAASGASWAAGIGTWYASVSTIRPTPSALSSSVTSDKARLRFKFACLSGSTTPLLTANGSSSIPASSASRNGVTYKPAFRPSIGPAGDAASTSANVTNLRKITEKVAAISSSSTSNAPVRLTRNSKPTASSGSLAVAKEVPRVAPLASTPGAVSLSSSVEQVETRVVPVVIGASSSTTSAKTTAYFRSLKPGSSGSTGSVNPEELSRPMPISASSSSSNSITTIVEIVLAASASLSSAHRTLSTAPLITTTSASAAMSLVELFATGNAAKPVSVSNSRSPPRVTRHPNPSASSSSATNVPPIRYIIRSAINASSTSVSSDNISPGRQIVLVFSASNASVIQRLCTRVPLGSISFSSTPLLTVTGSFVTASSNGSSSVNSRRLQRPLPISISGSSLRTVTEPLKRQVISSLSASSESSGNHNQLRANNASTSSSSLSALPEFGATVRIITRPTSLSIASEHLNSVFLVSANSSSSLVTYTASHLFLTSGSSSSELIIDHLCARTKPKAISASSSVIYLPIRFPVSVVSFSNTAMVPVVVETINPSSNSTVSIIFRPCQEEVLSVISGSNGIIYAGIVTVTSPISLSSGSVTARSILRTAPKPTSGSTLTSNPRFIVLSLPKIVSSSSDSATTRLQGRYLPSAASSSNVAVVSVIASTFRSFPSASSISTVATDPVLNIPILLNSISSVQIIAVFVETPSATSSSILNTATRTIRRETALASSGSVALFPAIVILQPKPALLTASSGSVTARLISRQKPPCSSSSKEINNSKQVYSAKRNSSSSSIASLVSEIIFRPHPNSLSASQDTCAIRTESRVTVNAIALSSARKAPEMRFVLRVHVNSSSSSNASSIIEISFSILTAFYPMVSSFTNAIAFTRGLQTFAGGAINASELEVVVISDFPDASTEDS